MKRALCFLLLAGVSAGSFAAPVSAETLREALAKAYQTNPTLTGSRAGLRAADENVPIAKARGLPSVDVSGQFTENLLISSTNFFSPTRNISARANLSIPIYQGGAVKNAIRAADARVGVGQANLRSTETNIFASVVGAYVDVLRDEAILGLNMKQVQVLDTNLQATRDRFEVGDLTRTDIAQSESRLAVAKSQLQSAEAQLVSSRERYVQLVGTEPGKLEQPPLFPNMPATPDMAVEKSLANNPELQSARKASEAAGFDVRAARSARLPRVAAVADSSYANFLNSAPASSRTNTSKSSSAGIQFSIPLYQGGAPSAQVRQAQARSAQAFELVIEAERAVIAQTRSAFASLRATNAVIQSSETAVSAAALSLEGVRAENSVGNRTILDILNAEQELLNAQVQLVSARRNAYVAGFNLLAAMGQAEADDLGLDGGTLYDPQINAARVRSHIWDWGADPDPVPIATRTVDTQPQNPSIKP